MTPWFGTTSGTASNMLNAIWAGSSPNCGPMLAHLANALPINTVNADGKVLVGYVVVCESSGAPACVGYGGNPTGVGVETEVGALPCLAGQDAHVILYWQ